MLDIASDAEVTKTQQFLIFPKCAMIQVFHYRIKTLTTGQRHVVEQLELNCILLHRLPYIRNTVKK